MSDTKAGEIHKRMAAVMGDIGAVGKDGKNEHQKYRFRSWEDLSNASHAAMSKHGVHVTSSYKLLQRETLAKGYSTLVEGTFTFHAPDGSSVHVTTLGEGADFGDKSTNKALTAAFKYALIHAFCIPTKDLVQDADEDSPDTAPSAANPVARIKAAITAATTTAEVLALKPEVDALPPSQAAPLASAAKARYTELLKKEKA